MTAIGRRAARLEQRLTRPNASLAELETAVALAIEHDCAAVTVSPWLVKAARRALGRSRLRLGTLVGSPAGTQILAVKAFEASKALEQGANQIDFVLNGGALLSGDDEIVFNDMLAVIDMAHSALALAGVVVESEPMTADQVSRACRIAERAGADYVITSAGELPARRAVQRTALLRDSVGPRLQVKAAGRFRTLADVRSAIAAGASRVSAEFSTELLAAATAALAPAPEPVPAISPSTVRPRAIASRAS
jgi:deoxyribose-phosphate aldolase